MYAKTKHLALCLLSVANYVIAQTPPYFSPSTSVNLPATFNVNSTNPFLFINGGVFSINATKTAPELFLKSNSISSNETFVVLMVDPDATSPQNNSVSEILHWLQPGVKLSSKVESFTGLGGEALSMLNTSGTGTPAITPYQGPAPPSNAPHRYTIMLFKQPNAYSFEMPSAYANYTGGSYRLHFNATAFVTAAGLGEPIAGTYFLAGLNTTGDGSHLYNGTDAAVGVPTTAGNSTPTGYGAIPTPSGSTGSKNSVTAFGAVLAVLTYFVV